MRRADRTLDLVANAALAGAALLLVARPRLVARVARSPLLPATRDVTVAAVRRFAAPAPPAPPWRVPEARQLARLVAKYAPARRSAARELAKAAGRRLNGSAALLAFSVLADSAIEHYRGSFANRAMYAPLVTAALTLAGSLFGIADTRPKRHAVRDAIYAGAAATGLAGFCFHAYNILKRPGGLSWLNLFYAAPVGAPAALTLAGLFGRGAERVRGVPPRQRPTILGMPAGRTLAAVAAAGLAGTVGEAALLHFRGAYHDPAMVLPVTVPPVTAAILGAAALRPTAETRRRARRWLKLTALLGLGGVGFHAFGVARNMGGWRNWRQNVLNGPPLPAPPSFTGLALAGLAVLPLIEDETDA
jgi:heme/copper-type cytochrome/quinol oxidase subunit 3